MKLTMFLNIFFIFFIINDVDAINNPYCSMSCGNITHACCKFEKSNPGPKCKPPYAYHVMSDKDRNMVLMIHNAVRNAIASGLDPMLPYPASNMQLMMYDKELEFLASCWASQCKKKTYPCLHSEKGPITHHVWQNEERKLGRTTGKRFLTYTLYNFHRHADAITEEVIRRFRSANLTRPLLLLTQMLWAGTGYVGCARVTFGSDRKKYRHVQVVCAYYPIGNMEYQQIYEIGKPCTGCAYHTGCHENYTSLCVPAAKHSLDTFNAPYEMTKANHVTAENVSSYLYILMLFILIYRMSISVFLL